MHAIRWHFVFVSLPFYSDFCHNLPRTVTRKDNAPQNFAVLRHMALNLLKQDYSVKAGVKAKRLKCGWDTAYLLQVLAG